MSLKVETVNNLPTNGVKADLSKLPVNNNVPKNESLLKKDELKTISANNVVVSPDKAFDLANPGRKVLTPTAASNGQNFYFLYSLDRTYDKIAMRTPNKIMVQDDIVSLRAKGYTVIVDNETTPEDFQGAVYDQKATGVVFLGHGSEGALVTLPSKEDPNVDYITHWDIDKTKVGKNLKMVYLQACQAGMEEKTWEKVLNTDVIAWTKSVSNLEVLAANGHIATAGIFPVAGAVYSVIGQINNKALGGLISKRF